MMVPWPTDGQMEFGVTMTGIISLHAPDWSTVLIRVDTITLVHRPSPHVDDIGAIVVTTGGAAIAVRECVAAIAGILDASSGGAA